MQDMATGGWRRFSYQQRNQAGSGTSRSALPVRILIVDHDRGSADTLEYLLRASDHSAIRVAHCGRDALAIAAEFHPQVVLLDVELADMNGYDVAQLLREQAQRQDLRLIALTSSREHAGRELARAAGFERYLLTPVTAADLAELLEMPSR
jgi:CheY-like chemotaxis protein